MISSTAARNASLDNDYGATRAPSSPVSHDLALFVGDPAIPEADGGGVELGSDGGYARVTIPNDAAWSPSENGAKAGPIVTFVTSTGAWSGTATHWALLGSDGLWWDTGRLSEPVAVTGPGVTVSCQPVIFDPADVDFAAPSAPPTPTVVTFAYTGAAQTWVVPAGVSSVTLECWGAQGGTGSGTIQGGQGGYATGTLAVTPGETLSIYVGGQGASLSNAAGGGGASDVRQGGTALGNRKIVAGGGGGTGYITSNGRTGRGGSGGGTTGANGTASDGASTPGTSGVGGGGTQSAGGASGTGSATAGALGQGGNAGVATSGGGFNGGGSGGYYSTQSSIQGGGGGGYYGGGGGNVATDGSYMGAGGGGSSYVGGVTGGSTASNQRSGNGSIVLTYVGV